MNRRKMFWIDENFVVQLIKKINDSEFSDEVKPNFAYDK